MNILWIQPNKTLALTSIFDGSDPVAHAALLQANGDIPADWVLAAASVTWPDDGVPHEAYRWDGSAIVADASILASAQIAVNEEAIQLVLDSKAQERGYSNIKSACAFASATPAVYSDDPHFAICERFRIEGNALQSWMTRTWATIYAYIASASPMLTPDQAVALMPAFAWPE